MLGLLGDTVIGLDHHVGPTEQSERERSRLARHEPTRGASILQDLGDGNRERSLAFFLDETFCDVERELDRLRDARRHRNPLRLFASFRSLFLGSYVIEELEVTIEKTTPSGRVVRCAVSVELVEAPGLLSDALGIAASLTLALASPFLRRR